MVQERYEQNQYYRELRQIALPISLQCLLQSSFSVVDQIMIGQLGSVSIAAIGLGGKFISLLMVMVQAVAAVAGIIMAQAVGKGQQRLIYESFAGICDGSGIYIDWKYFSENSDVLLLQRYSNHTHCGEVFEDIRNIVSSYDN